MQTRRECDYYMFRPYELKKVESSAPPEPTGKILHPRSGHRIVCNESDMFCFGGYSPAHRDAQGRNGGVFRELWKFNFFTRRWVLLVDSESEDMPMEVASCTLSIVGDTLIIFGGTGYPFGESSSNKCYYVQVNSTPLRIVQLEATGDPPEPQYGQAVAVVDDCMYAIGGTTGFDYSCDVHRLNFCDTLWRNMYPSKIEAGEPPGRYRHGIAYYKRQLFILGGGTSDSVFDLTQIPAFDLNSSKWISVKTKPDEQRSIYPEPRKHHSCVQCKSNNGEEVIITAGCGANRYYTDMWKLNLRTLTWQLLPCKLPRSLFFHDATVTSSGCMYIFGGIQASTRMYRTNNLYRVWINIPKLSEICWDAVSYYAPQLEKMTSFDMLSVGIPRPFVQRLGKIE